MGKIKLTKDALDLAHEYAKATSGCLKVQVGSLIANNDDVIVSLGANRTFPSICKIKGCLRVEKYGENFKEHRLPADCRALHSEIDAISNARESLYGATIYVTRYPCEACARAIVAAGITTVIYGRGQEISAETKEIFDNAEVNYIRVIGWDAEDVIV